MVHVPPKTINPVSPRVFTGGRMHLPLTGPWHCHAIDFFSRHEQYQIPKMP